MRFSVRGFGHALFILQKSIVSVLFYNGWVKIQMMDAISIAIPLGVVVCIVGCLVGIGSQSDEPKISQKNVKFCFGAILLLAAFVYELFIVKQVMILEEYRDTGENLHNVAALLSRFFAILVPVAFLLKQRQKFFRTALALYIVSLLGVPFVTKTSSFADCFFVAFQNNISILISALLFRGPISKKENGSIECINENRLVPLLFLVSLLNLPINASITAIALPIVKAVGFIMVFWWDRLPYKKETELYRAQSLQLSENTVKKQISSSVVTFLFCAIISASLSVAWSVFAHMPMVDNGIFAIGCLIVTAAVVGVDFLIGKILYSKKTPLRTRINDLWHSSGTVIGLCVGLIGIALFLSFILNGTGSTSYTASANDCIRCGGDGWIGDRVCSLCQGTALGFESHFSPSSPSPWLGALLLLLGAAFIFTPQIADDVFDK